MSEKLGITPKEINPYSRNNLWKLYSALALGPNKAHFISLWNRKEGDGLGGTKHMVDEVSKHFRQVHILDTNLVFNIQSNNFVINNKSSRESRFHGKLFWQYSGLRSFHLPMLKAISAIR
jgi:hypothetical protein